MVLQNAAAAPPDSFRDDTSSSTGESSFSNEADGSTRAGTLTISMSELPKPMPILGPLTGHTQAAMAKLVSQFVTGLSNVADRPMTQEEASIVAYYGAKLNATQSWGDGVGVLAGAIRSYQTAHLWKFPIRKPSETFNPDVMGPLRGAAARIGWHSMRFTMYALLGNIFVGFLTQSYALPVALLSIQTDPRLKSLNESFKRVRENRRGQADQQRRLPGPTPQQSSSQGTEAGSWSANEDDMSPAASSESWSSSYNSVPDTEAFSQQQRAILDQKRRQPAASSQGNSPTFDPDSPTGGFGPLEPVGSDGDGESGSAWDRIRQQAAAGESTRVASRTAPRTAPPPPAQKEQRDSSVFDAFGFGGSDEKPVTRAEAQRQFNASVDRERNGGDFEDAGKKW